MKVWMVVLFAGILGLSAVSCRGPAEVSRPSDQAPPAIRTSPAAIVLSPMSGLPLTRIMVYGSGFLPGEKVRVFLSLEGTRMVWASADSGGIVVANEYGAFQLKPEGGIPPAELIKPGVYSVEAMGDKDSLASAPLVVLEKKQEKPGTKD